MSDTANGSGATPEFSIAIISPPGAGYHGKSLVCGYLREMFERAKFNIVIVEAPEEYRGADIAFRITRGTPDEVRAYGDVVGAITVVNPDLSKPGNPNTQGAHNAAASILRHVIPVVRDHRSHKEQPLDKQVQGHRERLAKSIENATKATDQAIQGLHVKDQMISALDKKRTAWLAKHGK